MQQQLLAPISPPRGSTPTDQEAQRDETGQLREDSFLPGENGWHMTSQAFFIRFERNGVPHITTFAAQQNEDIGVLWRWLPRDDRNISLRFSVHGGHGRVLLLQGGNEPPSEAVDTMELFDSMIQGQYGEVVGSVSGLRTNENEVKVDWDLRSCDSANLKVVIIDPWVDPWGFVSVSEMVLTRQLLVSVEGPP